MGVLQRLAAGAVATFLALSLAGQPAYAATRKVTPTPRPTPSAPVKKTLPPQIYQLNPTKVNPTVQPNIMILGQYLTPASTVEVGGRPATTVQVPDPNHLLVKLPDNLSQGSYTVEVRNEAGTAVASDPLVVDDSGSQPSSLQYFVIGGAFLLLVLVMRLARTPMLG
jgi:IPT/TIG domain